MKKVAVIAAVFAASFSVFGIDIVKDGMATADALFDYNGWRTENRAFCGTGGNLTSVPLFKGDDFEVTGTMALKRVGHTAAGFVVDGVTWGLDSGHTGTKMFVENAQGAKLLGEAGKLFGNEEFFDFSITGHQGTMTLSVKGQKIGEFSYDPQKDCQIAIRPWRATVMVKNFSIKGQVTGKLSTAETTSAFREKPLLGGFVSIDQDARIQLPQQTSLPDGMCKGSLFCDNGTKTEFSGTLDGPQLTIPAAALKKAWASVTRGGLKIHPATLELVSGQGDSAFVGRMLLVDPAIRSDFAQGEVRNENGRPRFYINGQLQGFIVSRFSNYGANPVFLAESFTQFAQANVNGHTMLLYPYEYQKDGHFDPVAMEARVARHVARVLAINPNAVFFVQISLLMPESWLDANPDELVKLDIGLQTIQNQVSWKCQPSYASMKWRQEATEILSSFLALVRQTPYADRIACITPLYGNAGEWNHWGYHENAFVDYSQPMQEAFRAWLKTRYADDEALRKAWNKPDITLDSPDLVPPRAIRNTGTAPVRCGEKQAMQCVDYYTFFNEYTAGLIAYYGSVVKKASDRRLLYGTYYGYYINHYGCGPYHFQDSGHYGVTKLLQSPDVDWYGGPYTYNDRRAHLELNGIANSAALHGKLWMSEEDTRTHLCPPVEKQYGATADLDETLAIVTRNLMLNLERGSSCYYHDFTQDWYRDPEVMALIGKFQRLDGVLQKCRLGTPQVAMIFSEETIPWLIPAPALNIWRAQVEAAHMWSVPYDTYLLSDLDKIDFTKYKAVIFANTYFADTKIIDDIHRYAAGGNRILFFMYLPGVVGENGEIDPRQSQKLTGIPIEVSTAGNSLTSITSIRGNVFQHASVALKSRPVAESATEMLGSLSDGNPAVAVKKFENYTSVLVCHPMPGPVFMRDLFDHFRIHKFASGASGLDDVLVCQPLYAVYSRTGGNKHIFLNKRADIVAELFSGKIIGRNLYGFDFEMPRRPSCSVFFAGPLDEYMMFKEALEK